MHYLSRQKVLVVLALMTGYNYAIIPVLALMVQSIKVAAPHVIDIRAPVACIPEQKGG